MRVFTWCITIATSYEQTPFETPAMSGERVAVLPFLPGNSFIDRTKTKFHKSQSLDFKNGYSLYTRPTVGIGGVPIPANQLTDADLDELSNMQPTLTYGNARQRPAPVEFVPAHVSFDKKVLMFQAYFKQTVHESPNEFYRVRYVKIYYYLEDDSISIVEPPIENSGIPQGKLIKRHQVPCNDLGDTWHWKKLNIGIDVAFYGKIFHIYNCDQWTNEFMASEGIDLNPSEQPPKDPYIESRKIPPHVFATLSSFDKLKQFIELDRKVLRFYCIWDDRDHMFGEVRPYILHYYLVDDTVEVCEVHEPNDGRDPFPVLLNRQKLPKDRSNVPIHFPTSVFELSEDEIKEWITPSDLEIGVTVFINNRKFFIYDCDQFTRNYYKENFKTIQPEAISVQRPRPEPIKQSLPPYTGYGSIEDSKQSCFSLVPQPPKKDFIKMLENDGKVLRYLAVLKSTNPIDQNRQFIISYYLSDDTISIFEPPQRNSGLRGGQFLERTRLFKPGSTPNCPDYYSANDFAIGTTIEAFKHHFVITDADKRVLKYIKSRPDEFSSELIATFEQTSPTSPKD